MQTTNQEHQSNSKLITISYAYSNYPLPSVACGRREFPRLGDVIQAISQSTPKEVSCSKGKKEVLSTSYRN